MLGPPLACQVPATQQVMGHRRARARRRAKHPARARRAPPIRDVPSTARLGESRHRQGRPRGQDLVVQPGLGPCPRQGCPASRTSVATHLGSRPGRHRPTKTRRLGRPSHETFLVPKNCVHPRQTRAITSCCMPPQAGRLQGRPCATRSTSLRAVAVRVQGGFETPAGVVDSRKIRNDTMPSMHAAQCGRGST